MKNTSNLGLHLITESASDKSMLFSEWRAKIAGDGPDSNMNIIDQAIGDCQTKLDNIVSEDEDGLVLTLS